MHRLWSPSDRSQIAVWVPQLLLIINDRSLATVGILAGTSRCFLSLVVYVLLCVLRTSHVPLCALLQSPWRAASVVIFTYIHRAPPPGRGGSGNRLC